TTKTTEATTIARDRSPEPRVRREQPPSVAQGNYSGAVVSRRGQEVGKSRERIERSLFAVPLLHFRCNTSVLVCREALRVTILLGIARSDTGTFPKCLVLHDSRNDRCLRSEFDVCRCDVRCHHANPVVIVQEPVEKADESDPHVSRPLEAHMRRIEKHHKGSSWVGRMPEVFDCLRRTVFDDRDV